LRKKKNAKYVWRFQIIIIIIMVAAVIEGNIIYPEWVDIEHTDQFTHKRQVLYHHHHHHLSRRQLQYSDTQKWWVQRRTHKKYYKSMTDFLYDFMILFSLNNNNYPLMLHCYTPPYTHLTVLSMHSYCYCSVCKNIKVRPKEI
jgi:uncharacterized protein YydD (DUF2326 family)